ncbi:MAG TPA: phage tail sheath subtilisin-like domain-containing protein [Terriglobales bacterium]|nr:phage tail sheath subtilisin-like domain-containing protein [Terriglobales bacterium]
MPEYLAPGVYVEETSFTAPSIEGVGTTTTAFVGPTLTGPVGGMPYGGLPASGNPVAGSPSGGIPQLLTSFGDFQNIYGGYGNLDLSTSDPLKNVNYMAMAVQAFFNNGGSMLYVSRVYANSAGTGGASVDPGIATSGTGTTTNVVVAGRFPGEFLNDQTVTVTLTASKTQNIANLPPGSLLGVPGTGGGAPTFYGNGAGANFQTFATTPAAIPTPLPKNLYVLTAQVIAPSASGTDMVFSSLGLDPNHPNYIGDVLGVNPPRAIDALQNQIYFQIGSGLVTPDKLFTALFPTWNDPSATPPPAAPVATFTLTGGDDGAEPVAANYVTALQYCTALEDVAIVATPGSSAYTDSTNIMIGSVIPHVEAQRAYRVAILEAGPNLLDSDYENVRAQIDSSYCALYVPWVVTPNPLAVSGTSTPSTLLVPPSGFMAGIYARNDTQKTVAKAPANEPLLGAVDFERHITFAEQAVLNPLGINCLRFFPDRGYLVWGARTTSSDTELMYINVRRYLIYLEHSIDNGTQWAVFENNGPALWARVQDSIDSFLNNEFAEGNLLGTSPSDAYFVRCDRTTMTQNDLDNGRMICLIGVALLKPAEFVIFRIGQMTASAPS